MRVRIIGIISFDQVFLTSVSFVSDSYRRRRPAGARLRTRRAEGRRERQQADPLHRGHDGGRQRAARRLGEPAVAEDARASAIDGWE